MPTLDDFWTRCRMRDDPIQTFVTGMVVGVLIGIVLTIIAMTS